MMAETQPMNSPFLRGRPKPKIYVIKIPPPADPPRIKVKVPKPVSFLCTLVDPVRERPNEDGSTGADAAAD